MFKLGKELEVQNKTIKINRWTSHGKDWVAKITGYDEKKGRFQLQFCSRVARNWSWSGKTGTSWFGLQEPGYYMVSNPESGTHYPECIHLYYWDGGEKLVPVQKEEVIQALKEGDVR